MMTPVLDYTTAQRFIADKIALFGAQYPGPGSLVVM